MKRNWIGVVVSLAILAFLTGCGDDPADSLGLGGDDPSLDQLADVALQSDSMTAEMVSAEIDSMSATAGATTDGGPSGVVIEERTFRRTEPCPLGGQITVEGTIRREFDRATHVMEAESSGSRTRTDCAFPQGELVVTVDSVDAWEEFRRRVEGQPDGPQTSHYSGSIDAVRSDGEEHFCEYDYTIVRDPETQTRTINGTICGGRLRKGVPWQPRP